MKRELITDFVTGGTKRLTSVSKLFMMAAVMLTAVYATSAATFTVTKTADTDDAVCDSDCSLREAITAANASAGGNTIVFAAGANGTTTLGSALPAITNGNLTITGNGASNTIISGNNISNRIFVSFSLNVTISGLTLRDGGRGAITNYGGMTLNDAVITNNYSPSNGAIADVGGNLNVNRVTVTNNTGPNVSGIYAQSGNLNVTDSTFSGNSGAGTADVIRIASTAGGTATLTMVNSTISGNTSSYNNAGITVQTALDAASVAVANLISCTITNNSTTGQHGAIWLQSGPGTNVLNLHNTIVSGNLTGGAPFDIDGAADASSSFNLIGTGGGLTNGVNSNIVGVNDPQLLPLADNGGPTLTHKPLDGSPVIDAGINFDGSLTDQRGVGFARTVDLAPVNAGDGTDIGAFEVQKSLFNFTGFFQPVDNLPTVNIVNAGQAVPMKFSLNGYQGLNILASGYPISAPVACDTNESGTTIEETVTSGGSSLSYDQTTDQYSYAWKTDKAWKGTCRMFDVKLSDGTEHYAKFRFK